MRSNDQSSPDNSPAVPILDYRPTPSPRTGRERLAAAMEVIGVLSAMFAAFAVLLTIEMMFLTLVDLWTHPQTMSGELSYLAISAVSAVALIGVSIYANRLAMKTPH